MVKSALYDECLGMAFRIRELEPWEDLNDTDTYAVRMQDGTEMYVVTLGNGGESYDIQLYDGAESFSAYIHLVEGGKVPNFEMVDNLYWSDYMSVMYIEPADELMPKEKYQEVWQWAKAHGHKVYLGHGHPFLQKFRPHRRPCTPSDEDLTRMKEALEAVEWFSQKILDTDDLEDLGFKDYREYPSRKGGKVVPLVVKTEDGYKVERTKLPGLPKNYPVIVLPESELSPLRFMQRSGAQYCRLLHIPGFISEGENTENAFTALMLVAMDRSTTLLDTTELSELSDNPERDVLRKYIKKIYKDGHLPQRIITDNPRTEALLWDFCRELGIILELKRNRIVMLSDACQSIYNNFDGSE